MSSREYEFNIEIYDTLSASIFLTLDCYGMVTHTKSVR